MSPIVSKEVDLLKRQNSTTHPVTNSTTCPPTKTLTVKAAAEVAEEEEEEEEEVEEEQRERERGEMRSFRSEPVWRKWFRISGGALTPLSLGARVSFCANICTYTKIFVLIFVLVLV